MSTKPSLGPRTIIAYNRLSRDVAALNYLLRVAKPSGTFGEHGLRTLVSAMRRANRIYGREAGLPTFRLVDPINPMPMADVVLAVARLTAAGIAFEERYAHLTESGVVRAAATQARLDLMART